MAPSRKLAVKDPLLYPTLAMYTLVFGQWLTDNGVQMPTSNANGVQMPMSNDSTISSDSYLMLQSAGKDEDVENHPGYGL